MAKTQKKTTTSKEPKKKVKAAEPVVKKHEKRTDARSTDVEENDPSVIEAAFEPEDAKELVPGEFEEDDEYSDDMDAEETDWE